METTLPDSFLAFWESRDVLTKIAMIRRTLRGDARSHVDADVFNLAREIDQIPVTGEHFQDRRELAFGLVDLLREFQFFLVAQYGKEAVDAAPVVLAKHGFLWEAAKKVLTTVKEERFGFASWIDARAVAGVRHAIRHPLTNARLGKRDVCQVVVKACVEVAFQLDNGRVPVAPSKTSNGAERSIRVTIELEVCEDMTVVARRGKRPAVHVTHMLGTLLTVFCSDLNRFWSHAELVRQVSNDDIIQKEAPVNLRKLVSRANAKLQPLLGSKTRQQLIYAENGGYRLSSSIRWKIVDPAEQNPVKELTGLDLSEFHINGKRIKKGRRRR